MARDGRVEVDIVLVGVSTLYAREEPLTPALLAPLPGLGMECVELTDYHPNWSYLKAAWLRGVARDLAACGLGLNSVHIHLAWYDPELILSHVDAVRRRRAIEAHLRAVDALAMLGCRLIVTHDIAIPATDEASVAERARARDAFIDALQEVAACAAAAGIRMALENTTHGYATTIAALHDLIDAAAAPNLGICIDTGHANLFGPVDAAIRAAGPRLITLQVDDSRDSRDPRTQHVLPGRGTADWPAVMRALEEARYEGGFVYELNASEDIPLLAENYAWLRGGLRTA